MMLMQRTLLQLHFLIYIFIFPQLAEGQGEITGKNLKVFQISNKVVFHEDSLQKYLSPSERGLILFCPKLEFDSINYIQNAQNLLDDIFIDVIEDFSIAIVFFDQHQAKFPEILFDKDERHLVMDVEPMLFCADPFLLRRGIESQSGEFIAVKQLSGSLHVLQMTDPPAGKCFPKYSGKILFFGNLIKDVYAPKYSLEELQRLYLVQTNKYDREIQQLQLELEKLKRMYEDKFTEKKSKNN